MIPDFLMAWLLPDDYVLGCSYVALWWDESLGVQVTSLIFPRKVKPPVGSIYHRVEAPKGELGYFIISDGSVNPARVKVRAPSFVSLSAIGQMAKGYLVADVVAILGSLDIVLGEIDR